MSRIRIVHRKPLTYAYLEHTGPYGDLPWGEDIARLYAWARTHKARPGMRPMAVYLDDPARADPSKVRTRIAVPVAGEPLPEGGVGVETLPATRVVTTTHHGTSAQYAATYAALDAYAREHGLEASGPCIEVFTRKPKGEGKDAVLTSRVQVPVRPRAAS
jgi:effector-binding domain-containing protein